MAAGFEGAGAPRPARGGGVLRWTGRTDGGLAGCREAAGCSVAGVGREPEAEVAAEAVGPVGTTGGRPVERCTGVDAVRGGTPSPVAGAVPGADEPDAVRAGLSEGCVVSDRPGAAACRWTVCCALVASAGGRFAEGAAAGTCVAGELSAVRIGAGAERSRCMARSADDDRPVPGGRMAPGVVPGVAPPPPDSGAGLWDRTARWTGALGAAPEVAPGAVPPPPDSGAGLWGRTARWTGAPGAAP
ncbi:hypothetical protein [Streptomyces sp. NPDC023838]|uniref:hypothetical protein n=1 Tax=Streptomyces sp. NPDC023838 TaxID=3154325 RepID=UPI0033C735DB